MKTNKKKNTDKELGEQMVNMWLELYDKELISTPIYQRFLPKKHQSKMSKLRNEYKKIPKNKRINELKKCFESQEISEYFTN